MAATGWPGLSRTCLPLCILLLAATLAVSHAELTPAAEISLAASSARERAPSLPILSPEASSLAELRAEYRLRFGNQLGTAPGTGQNINIAVHAEITDPITKLLHSNWIWVIFILILLIIICVIAYCFRDQVTVCVGHCETCMYHTIKFLLLPFRLIRGCVQACFYPFKQCVIATKDRCTRYFRPSQTRVAGLRY